MEAALRWYGGFRGGPWILRLLLPAAAILLLVVLSSLYNVWADLTLYNLIRRSVASVALGALIFGPAVFLRPSRQALYLGVVWLLLALVLAANFIYARYAGGFLSASALSYLHQVGDTAGSIQVLLSARVALFIFPAVAFFSVTPLARRLDARTLPLGRRGLPLAAAGVLLVVTVGYGYVAWKEHRQYGDISRITTSPQDSSELVKKVGILNYSLIDGVNFLRRKKSLNSAEETLVRASGGALLTPAAPNPSTGILEGRNVVFLQLESIGQFLVGKSVDGQPVMPNLTRIAGDGLQFDRFRYVIGPGTSSDAEFVTFNSLMNLSSSAVVFTYPGNNYRAYPQLLKEKGYATAAYHADSKNFWNRANTFPRFGFDEYVAEDTYQPGADIGYGLGDKDFYRQTAGMIARLKEPYYAHLISLTSHTPYHIPKEEQKLDLSKSNLSQLQQDYLQSARYADDALGEFMDEMERRGRLENTVFVLMGDHEGFVAAPDDKTFAKFLGHEEGFGDRSMYEARRVPFVIYAPGSGLSGVSSKPSSQIDIYPTLTNLLGLKTPPAVMGVDLLGEAQPTVVRRSRGAGINIESAERGDLFYVANSLKDGKPRCYQGDNSVELQDCRKLTDVASARARISDLVIMGDRLDLLKP